MSSFATRVQNGKRPIDKLPPGIEDQVDALFRRPRLSPREPLRSAGPSENHQREWLQCTPIMGLSKVKLSGIRLAVELRDTDEESKAHGVVVSVYVRPSTVSQAREVGSFQWRECWVSSQMSQPWCRSNGCRGWASSGSSFLPQQIVGKRVLLRRDGDCKMRASLPAGIREVTKYVMNATPSLPFFEWRVARKGAIVGPISAEQVGR
jgi:hypothetical protein